MRFVHLRVRSEYSLLNSVVKISKLVDFAKDKKPISIGLMDDISLSGSFEFSSKIAKAGVKPIVGLNMFIAHGNGDGILPALGFLAKSERGYQNLIAMLHKACFEYTPNASDKKYIKFADIATFSDDLICISGGYTGLFGKHFLSNNIDHIKNDLSELKKIFGNDFYIELTRHGRQREKEFEDFMIEQAFDKNIPLVATNDVHFLSQDKFVSYDVLSCIRDGRYIYEKDRPRLNNQYYLKGEDEMIELFNDIPEAVENTIRIAQKCSLLLKERKPMLPAFTENGTDDEEFIKQARDGLLARFKHHKVDEKLYQERLEFELDVIIKMGFAGYFLIVSDFIKWSKENGIPVGPGRGSGAGSIVAWSLLITNLDPIYYGLLFERFLNPERVSMPDFDIDFCQDRREEVMGYVRRRYGSEKVANIITFGKLQAKAALKDVGRVLHINYNRVDEICKLIPFNPAEPITIEKALEMDSRLQETRVNDPDIAQMIEIAMELEGLCRHTSTHAAGVIIADRDLTKIAPIYKDLNSDASVLGFHMKDAEKIGLVKFDFLGLKTLTVINDTCKLVEKNTGEHIDIDLIDINDGKTFELLRSTKLKGVFQLEAAIPREVLRQIATDRIEDLIAITSLNRPGPMDNMPLFVRRKTGVEHVVYLHNSMEETLSETFGIIIYQEQVMKIAQVFAGYTLGGADLLRRAMGKKIKEEMDAQRSIFVEGAKKVHNVDDKFANEVFDLVEKFAGYGFNKSHAAAYSVISYQTAYLKAHYPLEFFISMLNLDINNTDKLNEFVNDAKSTGIKVLAPDINVSEGSFSSSIDRKDIIYGLGALKSVGLEASKEIVEIRKKEGGFKDIFHFAKACGKLANKKTTESLIKSGAFDTLHTNRTALIDQIEAIVKYSTDCNKANEESSSQDFLFGAEEVVKVAIPKINNLDRKIAQKDAMDMEFEAIGFYLTCHPLDSYRDKLFANGIVDSSELNDILADGNGRRINMAGVITKIVQRFGKKGRFAFLHLADMSGIFETMIFSDELISKRRDLLIEGNTIIVNISAKKEDESAMRMIVNDIFKIEDVIDNATLLTSMTVEKNTEKRGGGHVKSSTSNYSNANIVNKDIIHDSNKMKDAISINNFEQRDLESIDSQDVVQHFVIPIITPKQMHFIYNSFKNDPKTNDNGAYVTLDFGNKKIKLKNRYDKDFVAKLFIYE